MSFTTNDVARYYNEHVSEEDSRLDNNELEMPQTLRFIRKYVKRGGKILDLACGTGRYASVLLEMGYKLALNDISEKNIELVRDKFGNNKNIISFERSDAGESEFLQNSGWDAILLLGPLYHVPDKSARLNLLKCSKHALSENGYLFAAFMSRVHAFVYGLKQDGFDISDKISLAELWSRGRSDNIENAGGWLRYTYFDFPEAVNPLIAEAGLKPVHLIGIEGLFGERMELYHRMNKQLKSRWKKFIMDHCEDLHMIEQSKHLLSISQRGKS